jgi:predicted TIM-barrel fold metal-dependent hydrolase
MGLLNKNVGAYFLTIALSVVFTAGAIAQEKTEAEPGFFETLRIQEDQEHQELINSIKSADDKQYRGMIRGRIDKSYPKNKGNASGLVVVEVTDEMNQPEPGLFAKLFSSSPTEEEYGVDKVERLLSSGKGNDKELKYKQRFTSSDNQRHFQTVEGVFSKDEAMSLSVEQGVIDFYFPPSQNPSGSTFIQFHTDTGRVLPPQKQKQYEDSFIRNGLYSDLMKRFESTETTTVEVNLIRPSSEEYAELTDGQKIAQKAIVDDFLEQWPDFEFTLHYKSKYVLYLETTKAHVEAMNQHELVSSLYVGDALYASSTR